MMNPWVLLGFLIFWIFSVGAAYLKGAQEAENKAQAAFAKRLEGEIAKHNENALIDAQAAAEVAAKEAAARTRTAMLRSQANEATRNKPMPVSCNLDTERVRVLSVAVQAANSDNQTATSRLRDATDKANNAIR